MDINQIAEKLNVKKPTIRRYMKMGMPYKMLPPHDTLSFNAADCLRWAKENMLPRKL